ncbi:MAG: response regulator [Rubrivivax sp.]|nr:response regulator [Pyrinomonadaceae bacterium]
MTPHPWRILCADDDPDTCEMVSTLLTLIGCEVITVHTAGEAAERIRNERFDLYVLDNWLPGGSGVGLCKAIRESGDATPVVFYSGAGYDTDRLEAMDAGAQAYLIKPGDVGLLVETVRRFLESNEPSREHA